MTEEEAQALAAQFTTAPLVRVKPRDGGYMVKVMHTEEFVLTPEQQPEFFALVKNRTISFYRSGVGVTLAIY